MADKKLPKKLNEDQINLKETEQRDKKIEEINSKSNINSPCQDVPGTSGSPNLPGAVPLVHRNNLQKSVGLSKSEHNLGKVTDKDLANALKLTSISYNTAKSPVVIPVTETKVPINAEETEIKNDISFVDVKSFMATSFKININGEATKEPVKNVNAAISTIDMDAINAQANTSCLTSTAQTDEPINKVTVTGETGMEVKESKISEKSKPSRNISEKDYSLGQRDSLSSIGSNVCRICMTRGRERLISPCNCKGSLANVHLTCLERWLNQVGRNHCELCGFSYPAIRTPRYTVLQALRLWFANPRNRSHLQSDCLIFWLLSTVTAGLLAVCIVGTRYFVMEGSRIGKPDQFRKDAISHRITETAMDFFMGIVLCGYTVTVYLLWKDHYVMWNRWRRANVNVRLLLAPDTNPVPFVPRARYHVL